MDPDANETLTLTLPTEAGLLRLTRLVTRSFLRQNGATLGEARQNAGKVERRCVALVRGARAGRRTLTLSLVRTGTACEVRAAVGPARPGRLLFKCVAKDR
ncbi:MAG: hypothetical protein ACRD6R_01465 [Candidatus Polarisedimenticolia bacterium]